MVPEPELVTPAALAVRHCRERGHKRVMLVMNEEVKRDFADLQETASDADAMIVGDLGATPVATAMVGDDIESDIGGALHAGLAAILVRTGKYREQQVRESGIEPTYVVDSIADLPPLLRR